MKKVETGIGAALKQGCGTASSALTAKVNELRAGASTKDVGQNHTTEGPDARLIAAAPDLLAACKEALRVRDGAGGYGVSFSDAIWENIEAAIGRAEGRA